MSAGKIVVFTDFDDTLTKQNVAQLLLRRFASDAFAENSARYRSGEITFREYQELSFNAVTSTVSEMQATAAEEIELRAGVAELASALDKSGGTMTVVSAGLRFYIDPVLQKHGFGHLPVVCRTATRDSSSSGTAETAFRYDYPFAGDNQEPCDGDWATCKCKALEQAGDGAITIFVGDGSTSDACAAPKADYVFARDRLLNICKDSGIPATPFDDLHPVAAFVTELHASSQARSGQQ